MTVSILKKLLAKNDDANPEMVLPFVFLTLVNGLIFTGMSIVLAASGPTGTDQIALGVISGISVLSWASLAILAHKYSRISM
jgi:hypothetical protein